MPPDKSDVCQIIIAFCFDYAGGGCGQLVNGAAWQSVDRMAWLADENAKQSGGNAGDCFCPAFGVFRPPATRVAVDAELGWGALA